MNLAGTTTALRTSRRFAARSMRTARSWRGNTRRGDTTARVLEARPNSSPSAFHSVAADRAPVRDGLARQAAAMPRVVSGQAAGEHLQARRVVEPRRVA